MTVAPLPPTVKGWCPGALRPMRTGDGLLLRIRATGGIWTPARARLAAGLARRYGNGLIDLSQRANLQIRGVGEDDLPELWAALRDAGLLDDTAEAEAVRNVVGSPLAGIDPTALTDGAALVAALETGLSSDEALHELPDKFGFLVDQGGRMRLDDVAADIRLTAESGGILLAVGGDAGSALPLALVEPDAAAAAALDLALGFLAARCGREGTLRRMADLVASDAGAVDDLRRRLRVPPLRSRSGRRRPVAARPPLGRSDGFGHVGAPFGRLTAAEFEIAAEVAPVDLRVTPWRSLIIPGLDETGLRRLGAAGFMTAADDPRLSVVACPGLACSSGQIDARAVAERLAPLAARSGQLLHVSGCAKGCARPRPAALLLVGRDGACDFVEEGRAGDPPSVRGLTPDQAEAMLKQRLEGGGAP